jgi:hypothetical protein
MDDVDVDEVEWITPTQRVMGTTLAPMFLVVVLNGSL